MGPGDSALQTRSRGVLITFKEGGGAGIVTTVNMTHEATDWSTHLWLHVYAFPVYELFGAAYPPSRFGNDLR